MWNTRRMITCIGGLCGIFCLLVPGIAWSGLQGPAYEVYNNLLDKLGQLTPGNTIAVDIGVNPKNYRESFQITDSTIALLRQAGVPEAVLAKLMALTEKDVATQSEFTTLIENMLGKDANAQYGALITQVADTSMAAYAFGDEFELRFQASQSCYLTMMHIAGDEAGGDITFLLPNQNFPDQKIEANQPYSTNQFGLHFTVKAPPTNEVVNLFCSQEKIDWFDANMDQGSYYIISPTDEKRLQYLSDKLDELERSEWGGTAMKIQIGSPTTKRAIKKFGAVPPIGATGTTGKGKFFPPIGATGSTGKNN
jgi:hypothetical protein